MNPQQQIRESMESLAGHFVEHPQDATSHDRPAVATLESGLRCKATGPKGETLVTDMPSVIGGAGSAPTPGWYLRAALANCDATMIAMRAAQLGIELTTLEVSVASHSDNRGLLDGFYAIPAGPLGVEITVRISARDVPAQMLRDLVHWAEEHSPVGDALRRAVSMSVSTEILAG